MKLPHFHRVVLSLTCIATLTSISLAADPLRADQLASQLADKGIDFLKTQQKPDGGWQNENDPPGITALVLRAIVSDPKYPLKTEFVRKGFDKLLSYQLDSGGIYQDMLANYNTAIAISALSAANNPSLKERLDKAVAFLKGMQWTETTKGPKGETIKDAEYAAWSGGFGYNRHGRPDLSNAQFSIQALHDAGLKQDDPAFKAAVAFLARTQNRSESNDQPWSGNDGGFVYSPANGGDSEAESYTGPDGRKMWRSYGTMTYAGLKSMIYAGVSKDDPRVKSAVDWIRKNWTLDENPGLKDNDPAQSKHGLFYYFYVMAKALHAYGEPIITDTNGTPHDWRKELLAKVASVQNADGSWSGENRWMENNKSLATAYAVQAIQEIEADLKKNPAK